MIKHHPSPEVLADYASGSLKLSHALCIATHLDQCDSCKRQADQLASLGAQLFEQQQITSSASHKEALKSKVFAMLDDPALQSPAETQKEGLTQSQDTRFSNDYRVPKSLQQFIKSNYSELDWSTVSPSIKFTTLLKDKDGSQIALSRVKPGGKMPHHRHTGDELTVVLEGAFSDETGLYRKGDFISRDHRHKHKPIVTKDAECICLMVLEAPIEFTGFFSRLLNPLVKRNHAAG